MSGKGLVYNMRGDRTSYTQHTRSGRYSSSVLFRVRGPHQIGTPQSLYDSLCASACSWVVLEALKGAGRVEGATEYCQTRNARCLRLGEKLNVPRGGVKIHGNSIVGDICPH